MEVQVLELDNILDIQREMEKIGVDNQGISLMAPKSLSLVLKLPQVGLREALILKQEMLSLGGDVALPRKIFNFFPQDYQILLLGNLKIYQKLVSKLEGQYFKLPQIAQTLKKTINNYQKENFTLSWRDYTLFLNKRTYLMGILNVTPDSFSDGGKFLKKEKAVDHALKMVEEGVDIIDIGGRSTRPGSKEINFQEELSRVIPVIEELSSRIKVPISIDTYRAKVAEEAIAAGASMVNDISGLNFDPQMGEVVAKNQVPVIVMHIKGTPENMQYNPQYEDLILEIITYLRESINKAVKFGVPEDKIIIDPGIGFGKTVAHNLEIIKRLKEFKILGRPISIGTSRKSFLANVLGLPTGEKIEERREGTMASVAVSAYQGASLFRVHDVKETKKVIKVVEAIKLGLEFRP